MRILVTGTRAPVALDLIRALSKQGHDVFSSDSMTFPLGRFSKFLTAYIKLPAPNRSLEKFKQKLIDIIQDHKIELLLPTCEEIFFISRYHQELSQYCQVFFDPLSKLACLHNKFSIMEQAQDCHINLPKTLLLKTNRDKEKLDSRPIVLKPVFSRFASNVVIKPSTEKLKSINITTPYVAQTFIEGQEICVYALANKGELLNFCAYHPNYTAGRGAGIYFEPATSKHLERFLASFIKKMQFTGQISFDMIENEQGLFLLECNPRATSGLHLMADHIDWQKVFHGQKQKINLSSQPKMLKFAMVSYGLKVFFSKQRKQFIKDYKRAQDVINSEHDGWMHIKSLLSIANIIYRAIRYQKNFKDAATDDIEWNGETL